MVGAVLLLRSFVHLQSAPLGFDADGVISTRVSLPATRYAETAQAGEFYERLLSALQSSDEIRSVAIGTSAPFAPGVRASFQPIESGPVTAAEHIVSARYFDVLSVPVLAGRSFAPLDLAESAPVANVSQRLARLMWPDANALGQTLERAGQRYEVVGIVGDVRGSDVQGLRGGGPDREPRAAVYFAAEQLPQRSMTLLVRSANDPAGVVTRIRDAVRQLAPALPVQRVRPLEEWFSESVAATRLTTTLATLLAASALVLTAVGIHGVLAYMVTSRTREIGVRMAMGATCRDVMAYVARQGMTWAASGIVLGLPWSVCGDAGHGDNSGGRAAARSVDVPHCRRRHRVRRVGRLRDPCVACHSYQPDERHARRLTCPSHLNRQACPASSAALPAFA
jgi:hypothetical protein